MFSWISRIFGSRKLRDKNVQVSINISEVRSYQEYTLYANEHRDMNLSISSFEKSIIPKTCTKFTLNGYCYVCGNNVDFLVDFKDSKKVDGVLEPNWRERLKCPVCRLNSRNRATVHIFEQKYKPDHKSIIYITEQKTALYKLLKKSFPNLYGSEYLGDYVDYGNLNYRGIRNESLTQLSFDNDKFDYILSFDVFEHINNYKKALAECCRCLKPGGSLLFSIPFIPTAEKNIVRSTVSDTGEVMHLLPPEYHGDPLSSDGCLCFYHFGWEIIDELHDLEFKDAKGLFYWSKEFGYLGGEQLLFAATKIIQL